MCGRYVIEDDTEIEEMSKILFELKKSFNNPADLRNIKMSGEIFPGDTVPIILPDLNNKIKVAPIKWGISQPKNLIINARSEGVATRPMFRNAIKRGRCIIPTNGFYEWKAPDSGKGKKIKYLIKKSASPMLYLAGIYDTYTDMKTGEQNSRFVIMTRDALGIIRHLHHRMPIAVEKRNILMWLNGNEEQVDDLINDKMPEYDLKAV